MIKNERASLCRMTILLAAGSTALLLSGCQSSQPKLALKSSSKEYFSEAAYGVKASPRVADAGVKMPRREGRYQLGKPYKVKDRWYRPELNPAYKKVGAASWYGSAFHGRLTANGEVYDMTRLTAAHPTMPLPSYARVTNLEDGSSIIVRVNDRGPFEKGRVIDLSKRAAQMLDYQSTGVAKVEVDYVGPAPLDTHDDEYLVASYRPGGRGARSFRWLAHRRHGCHERDDAEPIGEHLERCLCQPARTAANRSQRFVKRDRSSRGRPDSARQARDRA